MTSQDLFRELKDGDSWVSCIMSEDVWNSLPSETRDMIVLNGIRQLNESLQDNEMYQQLVRNVSKAKKQLRDHEYSINHGLI